MEEGGDENCEIDIASNIHVMLKNGQYSEVLNLIKKRRIKQYLKENSLDFIPAVICILREEFCNDDIENCLEKVLVTTAEVANSKEVLLALLEELEVLNSNKQFKVIMKPLKTVISKEILKNSKFKLFSWVFDSLFSYVHKLPIPSANNLEQEEKKLLDGDDEVIEISNTLSLLYDLNEDICKALISGNLLWHGRNSKEYFAFYILKYFDRPFAFLDIYQSNFEKENKKPISKSYKLCLKYFDMIVSLLRNPFKLLVHIRPKYNVQLKDNVVKTDDRSKIGDRNNVEIDDGRNCEVPFLQLSLGTFFYCLFGQGMGAISLPCIYSFTYLYHSCLPCCVHLMCEKQNLLVHKGLVLLKSHLDKIQGNILPAMSLDVPNHYEVMLSLVNVMTVCDNKECRVLALACFKSLITKFEIVGCIKLFSTLLSSVIHSGIQSVVIHELKECINKNLSRNTSFAILADENLGGNKLNRLLKLIYKLPEGEKTDLLDWSDKIMSALNLMIFLCLRDAENVTGFKNFREELIINFLQPLENGLRLSKGHYELKLKDITESKVEDSCKISFSLAPRERSFPNLPYLPPEQEKEVVLSALNYFDMIQSALARVNNLI